MHKTLRRLPSLDFLRGFEAAGRRLSFTRAAEELFVTQSALSRQVQALEEALGVAAVRAPASRAGADAGRAPRSIATSPRRSARSPPRPTRARAARARRGSRCRRPCRSRRCGSFRGCRRFARAIPTSRSTCPPTIALVDLARGDVDVAVRYLAGRERAAKARCASSASGCCRWRARSSCDSADRRSRGRRISRATCCCTSTIPTAACRGSTGSAWLAVERRSPA